MSGLGNFLNPSKLLSKDKKAGSPLRKDRTEPSVQNALASEQQTSSPSRKIRSTFLEETLSQKPNYTEDEKDPSRELVPAKNRFIVPDTKQDEFIQPIQKPRRKASNELYEQSQDRQKKPKYSANPNNDDIRPRLLRTPSQRSSDEQDNRSNRSGSKRDPRQIAKQRLRDHLQKLQNQQQLIKKTSEQFNRKLRRFIDQEFNKFREAVLQTVDQVLEQFEQDFKKKYEVEHRHTLDDFEHLKDHLMELTGRLEEMYDQVDQAGWRSVAKTMDSEHFRNQIEEAFVIPKEEIGKIELKINERRLEEFGQALERLTEVEVMKRRDSRRKPFT